MALSAGRPQLEVQMDDLHRWFRAGRPGPPVGVMLLDVEPDLERGRFELGVVVAASAGGVLDAADGVDPMGRLVEENLEGLLYREVERLASKEHLTPVLPGDSQRPAAQWLSLTSRPRSTPEPSTITASGTSGWCRRNDLHVSSQADTISLAVRT